MFIKERIFLIYIFPPYISSFQDLGAIVSFWHLHFPARWPVAAVMRAAPFAGGLLAGGPGFGRGAPLRCTMAHRACLRSISCALVHCEASRAVAASLGRHCSLASGARLLTPPPACGRRLQGELLGDAAPGGAGSLGGVVDAVLSRWGQRVSDEAAESAAAADSTRAAYAAKAAAQRRAPTPALVHAGLGVCGRHRAAAADRRASCCLRFSAALGPSLPVAR